MGILNDESLNLIAWFMMLAMAMVVTFRKKTGSPERIFLASYFWTFFYMMFSGYMVNYRYAVAVPHIFRTGFPVSLLMMPSSYLYMRQSLYDRRVSWNDLIHVLPFLLVIIDMAPFYAQSAHAKADLLRTLSKTELAVGFSQGMFMPSFGYSLFRYGLVFIYCLLQFRMLVKPVDGKDRLFLSWLRVMTISQVAFFLVPLIAVLRAGIEVYVTTAVVGAFIVALAQGYYLLFHPEILYGIPVKKDVGDEGSGEVSETGREDLFPDKLLQEAGAVLEAYMENQKPYLRGRFKMQDLSAETGIQLHIISAYVNRKKGMNFFNYINSFRIQECLHKFRSGEHEHKTLEALAEECGFQNRTTFIRVFKQMTGKTPTEYLAAQEKDPPVSAKEIRQG